MRCRAIRKKGTVIARFNSEPRVMQSAEYYEVIVSMIMGKIKFNALLPFLPHRMRMRHA